MSELRAGAMASATPARMRAELADPESKVMVRAVASTPFDEGGDGRGETLAEEHGEPEPMRGRASKRAQSPRPNPTTPLRKRKPRVWPNPCPSGEPRVRERRARRPGGRLARESRDKRGERRAGRIPESAQRIAVRTDAVMA